MRSASQCISGEWRALQKALRRVSEREGVLDLRYGGEDDTYQNGVTELITMQGLCEVEMWMAKRMHIVKLRLGYHSSFDDAHLEVLCTGLQTSEVLDELSLYGTSITTLRPLINIVQGPNNSLTKVNVANTPAAEDGTAMLELYWALTVNSQPLKLKYMLAKLKAGAVTSVVLDEKGGAKLYNDVALRHLTCCLNGCDVSTEPVAFNPVSSNTTLTHLTLTNGSFSTPGIALLSNYLRTDATLKKLDVSHNNLGSAVALLASSLTPPKANTSLNDLDLSWTGTCSELCGAELASMIAGNKSLTVVRLCGNNLEANAKGLVQSLYVSTSMKILDLENTSIDDEYMDLCRDRTLIYEAPSCIAKSVPLLFGDSPLLTVVDCSRQDEKDTIINDANVMQLLEAFVGNTMVTTLKLCHNNITIMGLEALCSCLSKRDSLANLTTLHISDLQLQPSYVDMKPAPARAVCNMLSSHPRLRYVDISQNYLEDDAGGLFVDIAKRVVRMTYLNTNGTPIDSITKRRLDLVLPMHKFPGPFAAVAWGLWGCGIEEGILNFSSTGQWWAGEKFIYSDWCNEGNPVELLCAVLEDESSITSLDVSGHQLGDEGVAPLMTLLQNAALVGMSLNNTGITAQTAAALAKVIQANDSIKHVEVNGNGMGNTGCDLVTAQLRFNATSQELKELLVALENNRVTTVRYNGKPGSELTDEWLEFIASTMLLATEEAPGIVEVLDLSHTHITNTSLETLTTILKDQTRCPRLRSLNLQNCLLTGTQGLAQFLEAASRTNLTEINLSHNALGVEGYQVIVSSLGAHDSLCRVIMTNDSKVTTEEYVTNQLETASELNAHLDFKKLIKRLREGDKTVKHVKERNASVHLVRALAPLVPLSAITEIDLSGGVVNDTGAGLLAKALESDPPVTNLDLACNHITTMGCRLLASALGGTTQLLRLDLSGNRIDGRGATAVIGATKANKTILMINLSNNPHIPESLLESLQFALINDQQYLSQILPCIEENNTDVDVVSFADKVCNTVTVALVTKAMARNTCVKILDFSNSTLSERSAQNIQVLLKACPTLKELYLHNCDLTDSTLSILTLAAQNNHGLETFGIAENPSITANGIACLTEALGTLGCDTITKVDTKGIRMSDAVRNGLDTALKVNESPVTLKSVLLGVKQGKITKIELSGASAPRHPDWAALTLSTVVPLHSTVTSLDLSHNDIGDEGAGWLSEMLHTAPHVTYLDVSHNDIGNSGICSFTTALWECDDILHLDVSHNKYSTDIKVLSLLLSCNAHPILMKKYILNWLKGNTTEELVIDGACDAKGKLLTDVSLEMLCEFLCRDPEVSHISLCNNDIQDKGAMLLARSLAKRNSIASIDLRCNRIGDDGGYAIASLLEGCCITRLDLGCNRVTDSTALHMVRHVGNSYHIKALDLAGNPVTSGTLERLGLMLTLNNKNNILKELVLKVFENDASLHSLDLKGMASQGLFDTDNKGYTSDNLPLLLSILQTSSHITALDMSRNGIGDVEAVSAYLKSNTTLRCFKLNDSPLGQGAPLLFQVLKYTITLTHVELVGCKLTDDMALSIVCIVGANRALQCLDLSENFFTHETVDRVVETVNECPRLYSLEAILLYPSQGGIDVDYVRNARSAVRLM